MSFSFSVRMNPEALCSCTQTPTHPNLPFPQSTMRQTQMLASLTHNGEGQTWKWEGVSAGGGPPRSGSVSFLPLDCYLTNPPPHQGQKLASVRFYHHAKGAQRKVGPEGREAGGRCCPREATKQWPPSARLYLNEPGIRGPLTQL